MILNSDKNFEHNKIQTDTTETFIEVDYFQKCKYNQRSPGDVFLSEKNAKDGRTITTLSDGLGSGIKADVLATLTATMATKFIAADIPIKKAAEIIMNTLPVDKVRGISYATFTLVDIEPNNTVTIMEYDNPPYLLIREQTIVEPIKERAIIERKNKKAAPHMQAVLHYSKYQAKPGDRIIFFSDGVTQSGMGSPLSPFGWGIENTYSFILQRIQNDPDISARELAKTIVQEAIIHDSFKPKDDISCGVVYFRKPRDVLILTGPPFNKNKDAELARNFSYFEGKKIICGGTTTNILSRELSRPVSVDMSHFNTKIPPYSSMEGAALITEGIITLAATAECLETKKRPKEIIDTAVDKLLEILLNSDRIYFVVGTKINEAHQDPSIPEGLEIRRNIVKKIASLLQENYLKEVNIQYL